MKITKGVSDSVRSHYPDHTLPEIDQYTTLRFHDTMQVASTDSTVVTIVYVCGQYV